MKRELFIPVVMLAALVSGLRAEAFMLAALPAAAEVEAEPAPVVVDRFPIVTRIELARDYGFFIGDEIPLTLTIEVETDVILDLINLPRAAEQHGPFEVRDMVLTSSTGADRIKTYEARYRLQYFGVAPLTIEFKPLEILYASRSGRDPLTQTYAYKSLFTQPVIVDISRIGPYRPTHALGSKGPLENQRLALFWIPGVFGVMCVLAAMSGWGRDWRRSWHLRQNGGCEPVTAASHVLAQLRQVDTTMPAANVGPMPVASQLGYLVRTYLQDSCGVSAYTLTPTELAARLEPTQPAQDVIDLLQRCDTVKYQPVDEHEAAEKFLWKDAVTLFEQLD